MVFRFWDHEVKKELDKCLYEVIDYLDAYKNT